MSTQQVNVIPQQHTARRIGRLGTETAYAVSAQAKALAATGKTVYPFHIGDLSFRTSECVVNAAKRALDDGKTGYCPAAGIPQLREAIASYVGKPRGVRYLPEQVSVQSGGKPVIFKFLSAVMDEGDEVLFPSPGYPIYESVIDYLGGKSVPYCFLEQKQGFVLDLEDLERKITPRTKVLIVNNHQNPMGVALKTHELAALARISREHDLMVLSDEPYFDIVYDGEAPQSIVSFPGMLQRTCILFTFSKSWAMTGWRLGAALGPEWLTDIITKLNTNDEACTTHFVQYAGVEALTNPQAKRDIDERVRVLKIRRDLLIKELRAVPGFSMYTPGSTFYLFVNCTEAMRMLGVADVDEFRQVLLHQTGVSVTSRNHFGTPLPNEKHQYIRFAYSSATLDTIRAAGGVLREFMTAVRAKGRAAVTVPWPTIDSAKAPSGNNNSLRWATHNPGGQHRVVVTKNMPGKLWLQILVSNGCRVEVCENKEILTNAQIKEAIGSKCFAVLGQLTENWNLELFQALRDAGGQIYSQMAVGFNNVDVKAATQVGVYVGNTPGVLTETTAEMAVALTFAAGRRIVESDEFLRAGLFKGWLPDMYVGKRFWRGTVGIIGAGRIGSAFATMMMEGHKMNVVYFDLYQAKHLEKHVAKYSGFLTATGQEGVTCTRANTLEELMRAADVVSVHTVLADSTRGMINAERLGWMKSDAVFVNTARGPIVVEKDLIRHLRANPQFTAGLDVFENEPALAPGLSELKNCVMCPHIASASMWTRAGMSTLAACNIVGTMRGYPVFKNPSDVRPFVDQTSASRLPKFCPSILNHKDVRSKTRARL